MIEQEVKLNIGFGFSPSFEVQKKRKSGDYHTICMCRGLNQAIEILNKQKSGDYKIVVVLVDTEIERLRMQADDLDGLASRETQE